MCWTGIAFNHCYDCSREFGHTAHTTPCHASENGQPCALIHLPHYIIHTGENCAECKASREAEEECQRKIYNSRPLNLDVKNKRRMRGLLAAYRICEQGNGTDSNVSEERQPNEAVLICVIV
ncbi:hypothetical protein F4803DRAFT_549609 [Xylaria telfairii]|nr:hypothetical protein F4803DRAFT_549609 [Xylaria telfairii]